MSTLTLSVDGNMVQICESEWPMVASANRTKFIEGGYVTYTMAARRHGGRARARRARGASHSP